MDNLERQLRQLSSLKPSSQFQQEMRQRLMHQISEEQGTWFALLLKKAGFVSPRPVFVEAARIRLLSQISQARHSFSRFWLVFKGVMASTLVLTLAVTSTLFFVDGKQMASAAEDTYVEALAGTISVRRADQLTWNDVTASADLFAGDLIRVPADAQAVVRFFDDSELRLAGGSLALINQFESSPVYSRQGRIEVFLHEGKAWIQTLNVDDGFAAFRVATRDLAAVAQHASFVVNTHPFGSSTVQVYKYGLQIENGPALHVGEKLLTGRQFIVEQVKPDLEEAWVKTNVMRDEERLAMIRERELQALHASTGVVPGEVLYPVKQIKERIALALAFDEESEANLLVSIANKRLKEAMVLIDEGNMEAAQEAILAYQSAAAQVSEQSRLAPLLAAQKKTLVAALPVDSGMSVVKAVLDAAQEQAASAPLEREKVRLKNVQDQMFLMQDLVASGDLEAAKALMAQVNDAPVIFDETVSTLSEEEQKTLAQWVAETRQAELKLFEAISETLGEENVEMAALLQASMDHAKKDLLAVQDYLVEEPVPALHPWDAKIAYIQDKMAIYTTWNGQKNQLERILKEEPSLARNPAFLRRLKSVMEDQRAADYVNIKIHQANLKDRELKGKQIQWRIERSKRLREANEEKLGDPAPSRE